MADNLLLKLIFRAKDEATGVVKKLGVGIDRALKGPRAAVTGLKNALFNVKTAIVSAGAALGAFKIGSGIVNAAADLETLKARLETVTGSSDAAAEAFARLEVVAGTDIPLTLEELTEAYIKLTALGIEPSEEALISYANTAAATGKSLDQFVEAVADAATGEFERLKEFGIKASAEGQKVAFTFQGLTTTVGNSAGEIEAYLRQIGNTQFAGALEKQGKTFNGVLKSIQKAYTQVLNQLAQGGLFEYIKEQLETIQAVIQYAISSGKFREWGEQIGEAATQVGTYLEGAAKAVSGFINGVLVAVNAFTASIHAVASTIAGFWAEIIEGASKVLDFMGADVWAKNAANIAQSLRAASEANKKAFEADTKDLERAWDNVVASTNKGKNALTGYIATAKEWKASQKKDVVEPTKEAGEEMQKAAESTIEMQQALALVQRQAPGTADALGSVKGELNDLSAVNTTNELFAIAHELQELHRAGKITDEELDRSIAHIEQRMAEMADTASQELFAMREEFAKSGDAAEGLAQSVDSAKSSMEGVSRAAGGVTSEVGKANEEASSFAVGNEELFAKFGADTGRLMQSLKRGFRNNLGAAKAIVERYEQFLRDTGRLGGDAIYEGLGYSPVTIGDLTSGAGQARPGYTPPAGLGTGPAVPVAVDNSGLEEIARKFGTINDTMAGIGRDIERAADREQTIIVDGEVLGRTVEKDLIRREDLRA